MTSMPNNDLLPNLTYSADSIDWPVVLPSGATITLKIQNLRPEKTGLHGFVAVVLGGSVVAHDTFNLGRSEERRRLARRGHSDLGIVSQEYSREELNHDLDILCLWACEKWMSLRFQVERVDPTESVPPIEILLDPYIIEGGGSILFSAPGNGKSFVAMLMACCLANGLLFPWPSIPSPVLFINLERSRRSLMGRDAQLRRALGIPDTGIEYIHAAGRSYKMVHPVAKRYVENHPGTVVFLDSISRAGLGSLSEDDTANSFIDSMNSLETAWLGLGHTPKHSQDTLFGSQHFTAGEDIGIKLSSQLKGNVRGIGLKITKANDILIPPMEYIALEFDEHGLSKVRSTSTREFPALSGDAPPLTDHEAITAILSDGAMTVAAIAQSTGKTSASCRTTIFRHHDDYVKIPGNPVKWGLATETRIA